MFFKKVPVHSISDEKDARIADLKAEIAFLRSMVSSVRAHSPTLETDMGNVEANAILNGLAAEQIDYPMSQEDPRVLAERDALLNGNY